jgi:glycosyltransferase involved in cell wall biosynthesis
MKVMLIGVFLDGTGWAHTAIDYALALDSVGVDVVCRHVKLNNVVAEVPQRIKELLDKSSNDCDAVIQHLLPPQYEYHSGCGVNIGLYCTEYDNFKYSDWASYIDLMDSAWVFNAQSKQATLDSGVSVPVHVVNPPTDLEKFYRSYDKLPLPELQSNSFKFYTIGEFVRRKNFAALIKAFHTEFSPHENVDLVIKTGLPGMKNQQEVVRNRFNEIKHGLRLYPSISDYKEEIVITSRLSELQVAQLHNSCDCHVYPSYGEAWSISSFDALGYGKTPITGQHTGFLDYLDHHNAWFVDSRKESVFGMNDVSPPNYATARDNWWSIDPLGLQKAMREAFEDKYMRERKAALGIERVEEFSYKKIGERMKMLIENSIMEKNNDK